MIKLFIDSMSIAALNSSARSTGEGWQALMLQSISRHYSSGKDRKLSLNCKVHDKRHGIDGAVLGGLLQLLKSRVKSESIYQCTASIRGKTENRF